MPAPEEFFDKLSDQLRQESDRELQDKILDIWLKAISQATEWDAEQWGFDPLRWMESERDQLAVRAYRAREKQGHAE